MFNNDWELIPRTYSIKGYRRRGGLSLKKVLTYLFYTVTIMVILGITLLSIYEMV